MMDRDAAAAAGADCTVTTSAPPITVDSGGSGDSSTSAETAVAIEFVASLFRNDSAVGETVTPGSSWNVTFPGLSLLPPDLNKEENATTSHGTMSPHSTTTRHAAEVHAVTLLCRPAHPNQSLRENAFASFFTLVDARLKAYVRRWPALAGLLQYRIVPTTLLSRLEVLQPSISRNTTATDIRNCEQTGEDDTITSTKHLALCCWSMAMDLVLESAHDASKDLPLQHTTNDQPIVSVSFSTLGSISQDCSQPKHLIVELDVQVLLAEMIRQASVVVSTMVQYMGNHKPSASSSPTSKDSLNMAKANPPPAINSRSRSDDDVSKMPPPPPRLCKRPVVMVVSPDLSSTTAQYRCGGVPSFDLDDSSSENSSLSVDQCADIVDTCLTEFTPMRSTAKRAKLVLSPSTFDA